MSPTAFRLTKSGIELRNPDFDMLAETYAEKGYAMWPLVDNNFDPKLTHEILSDSRLQDTMIRQLMATPSSMILRATTSTLKTSITAIRIN